MQCSNLMPLKLTYPTLFFSFNFRHESFSSSVFSYYVFVLSISRRANLAQNQKRQLSFIPKRIIFGCVDSIDQAITLLNQAIEKDDNFVEAYYRLGLTYFSMKQYGKSLEKYEKGLSLTSDIRKQKVFWYDMGELYLLAGEYEKAMKVFSAFVNNETQNKAKIDRATMLFRSAEFAMKNKTNTSAFKLRPLSDTVNRFVMQYFPVLTADQSS